MIEGLEGKYSSIYLCVPKEKGRREEINIFFFFLVSLLLKITLKINSLIIQVIFALQNISLFRNKSDLLTLM